MFHCIYINVFLSEILPNIIAARGPAEAVFQWVKENIINKTSAIPFSVSR